MRNGLDMVGEVDASRVTRLEDKKGKDQSKGLRLLQSKALDARAVKGVVGLTAGDSSVRISAP